MTSLKIVRGRPVTRATGVCLATATALVIPSVAIAADSGAHTIVAQIGPDGSVQSTKDISVDGVAGAFSGQLPVKLSITRTTSGGSSTYTYHVENTFSRQESVTSVDTQGRKHVSSVTLQLPLVAQLGVTLPSTMKNVSATGATITTDSSGVKRVLWNLVLFAPLGSAAVDEGFTAAGSGTPVAELRATAVNPSATQGLSATAQDSNAAFQQDDFWAGYASGGNGGLTQLADGATQLYQGLKGGLSGTQQAADGSVALFNGSKQVHAGLADNPNGLTGGLRLIHNGLLQLADNKAGLPAAVDGIKQLQAGVAAALAGVGDDSTPQTIINGVDQISGGLALVIQGIQTQLVPGLQCLADVENGIVNGASAAVIAADPCYQVIDVSAFMVGGTLPGVAAIDPNFATNPLTPLVFGLPQVTQGFVTAAVTGINDPDPTKGLLAALGALKTGADELRFGLSHAAKTLGPTDVGGLKEGLALINGGLLQLLDPKKGLPAAVSGVDQLATGTGKALHGSELLLAGTGFGPKELTGGLKLLSDGLVAGAKSFPQAVSGANQIAQGVKQVQAQAVAPLLKQLQQASQNAHQQIAVIDAAAALADQAPGGANAVYVLSQDTQGFRLAAASTKVSSGGGHTARDVGIGLGGLALLVVGTLGGFAMGRRGSRVAV